jgi:hypothetical protein
MAAGRARIAALSLIAVAAIAAAAVSASEKGSAAASQSLDTPAMNAMLRADRDKDGLLSREELDQYDLTTGRRFRQADGDRDGKLTLYEFETLLAPDAAAVGATR